MNPSIQTSASPPRSPSPRSSSDALSAAAGAAAPGDFSAALRAIQPVPTPDATLPREASPPRHVPGEDRGQDVPEGPPVLQTGRPRRIPGGSTTPPGGPRAQAPGPDTPTASPPNPLPMPEALLPPDAARPPAEAPIALAPELPEGVVPQPEAPISPIAPLEAEPPPPAPPASDRQPPWVSLPPEGMPVARSPWPQPAPSGETPAAALLGAALPTGVLADARAAAARVAKPVLDPEARAADASPAPAASAATDPASVTGEAAPSSDPSASGGTWALPPGTLTTSEAVSEARPLRSALPVERANPEAPRAEMVLPEGSARAEWLQAAQPMQQGLPPSLALPVSPPLALNQPAFADELGTQVAMWTRQGVQQAELRLNPAELGPVQVRIQLQGDQAQVQFVAEAAATRDALQAALPELGQALAAEGLQLAGADVQAGRQGARDTRHTNDAEARRRGVAVSRAGLDGPEPEGPLGAWPPSIRAARGLLDLYA